MVIEYPVCTECVNYNSLFTCSKRGKCGRIFDNGTLVNTNGTTSYDVAETFMEWMEVDV